MKRIEIIALMAILLIFLLSGCSQDRHVVDTVEVKVPVIERAVAPAELFRPRTTDIPIWVTPSNPAASVCVTGDGETKLKAILLRDESLLDGWEAYGR